MGKLEFFDNVIEYFDSHSGYDILLSFIAIFISTVPYIVRWFKCRFNLKIGILAYRIMDFNKDTICDYSQRSLALQISVTNLSERPCTITEMYLNIDGEKKYFSYASELIFTIEHKDSLHGEYRTTVLPQHLEPNCGTCGCFIVPNFDVEETILKKDGAEIEITCGKKKKKAHINFGNLRTPLLL